MCTIATCSWPFFKQAAIMNMAYPLFILVACKSDPLKAYKEGGRAWLPAPSQALQHPPAQSTACLTSASSMICWQAG